MAFPTIVANTQGVSAATNTTSHPITLPSGSVGDMLFVIMSTTNSANISPPAGYTLLNDSYLNATGGIGQKVFWKTASATSETLTVTTTTSCQSSYFVYRLSGAAHATVGGKYWSSTAITNPSMYNNRASDIPKDNIFLAVLSTYGSTVATAVPTNYTGLITQSSGSATGASISIASNTSTSDYIQGVGTWTTGAAAINFSIGYCIEPTKPWGRPYLKSYIADYASTNPANSNITYEFWRGSYGATQNTVAGDIGIMCVATSSIGQVQRNPTIVTSGWNLLKTTYQPGASFSLTQTLYYKQFTGSENTLIWNPNAGLNETSVIVGAILRPPDGTQTFTVRTPNTVASNVSFLPDPPAVSPNVASDVLLAFGSEAATGASQSFAGFTYNASDYWFGGYSNWSYNTSGSAVATDVMHIRWNGKSGILDPGVWSGGFSNSTGGATITSSVVVSMSGGTFKVHNGDGTFTAHQTKYYSGATNGWYTKPVLVWNGSTWLRANTT